MDLFEGIDKEKDLIKECPMESESIARFVDRRILVLHKDTSVGTVARALQEKNFGSAVISDRQGHMVGIVTDRDLACSVLAFGLPAKTAVSEVMTTDILSVARTAGLPEVIKIMEVNGIRRIPVIKRNGQGKEKCVGMITLDDLIATQSIEPGSLRKIVRAQIARQPKIMLNPERKMDRREQVYNHFYNVMAKELSMPRAVAERVSFYLLKSVIQRLPSKEAEHFIAQLPSLMHEDLLSLPAGPHKSISGPSILQDLELGLQLGRGHVLVPRQFWQALNHLVDPSMTDRLLKWLPTDLQKIFTKPKTGARRSGGSRTLQAHA
ncbi:MAG: hypothetical protein C5B49_04790 [Bdellovibrio sp.]|nr:MAG: hypothetical protein C5B49_04790 [Bdellovibrio sp.]